MRKTTVKTLRKDFHDTHSPGNWGQYAWRYLKLNRPDRVRYLAQIA